MDRTLSNQLKLSPQLESTSHNGKKDNVVFLVHLSESNLYPDIFTCVLNRLELVSIENVCHWIFYKIIRQHHILYDNVKLSVVYKNPAISPVVLKNYSTQERAHLDQVKDDLLLDYFKTKERVYIKAETR